jgi:hypothetical protein
MLSNSRSRREKGIGVRKVLFGLTLLIVAEHLILEVAPGLYFASRQP